jgi:hypothetical protein
MENLGTDGTFTDFLHPFSPKTGQRPVCPQVSQWVALVNNIPTLASRLNGLSIANVAASSHSYDLNRRRWRAGPPFAPPS